MNHNPRTVERFRYIPEGDNIANHIDELPEELKISRFYSRGNTMRLAGNEPSPTLVPGHSNFPIHPREHRSITVREAATITGFPIIILLAVIQKDVKRLAMLYLQHYLRR